ncbi:MAG: phosphotransferase, partial [Planctomycetota bacterium]
GLIQPKQAGEVEAFLRERGWLRESESVVGVAKAGEGNMNLTMRVEVKPNGGDGRTLVVKQSRPWVEKYPSIAAPAERVRFEHGFYRRASEIGAVSTLMPDLVAADLESNTLVLEDLGEASDFTTMYEGGSIRDDEVAALAGWSAELHAATRGEADPAMANRAMRRLNHAHIFDLPLSGKLELPLDEFEPGLAEAAAALQNDEKYVAAVRGWGERYLTGGSCLLHGDFYPGSWLRTAEGTRVIDPEFCFYGDPAFDVAVALAHLVLAGEPWETAERWLEAYREAGGQPLSEDALAGYAGTEVMRRVIGVAQLPVPTPTGGQRAAWLAVSREAVTYGELERLWD